MLNYFAVKDFKGTFMTSEETAPKQRSGAKLIYRFLGGAALGVFLVLIPILYYGSPVNLNLLQVGIASSLVLVCGLLSSVWGEKFIAAVMRWLEVLAP
jgi:hypothetical protein